MANFLENAMTGLTNGVGNIGDTFTKGFDRTVNSDAWKNTANAATMALMAYGLGAAGSSMLGGSAAAGGSAGAGSSGLSGWDAALSDSGAGAGGGFGSMAGGSSSLLSNPMFKNMASQGLMGLGGGSSGGPRQPQIDTNEYLRKRQADERGRLMAQALMNRPDNSTPNIDDQYLSNQQA